MVELNYIYAQLNNEGFCIGISTLVGEIDRDDLIKLDDYDFSLLGRKYNKDTNSWTEEYLPNEDEGEEVVTLKSINESITPISKTTQMTAEDALTIIEYLTIIEEKIDSLILKK